MLSSLLSVVNFMKTVIYYGLLGSFKVGQFIVNSSAVILKYITSCVNSVLELLGVILESFTIFFNDVLHNSKLIIEILSTIGENIVNGLTSIILSITSAVDSVAQGVNGVYNFLVNGLVNIVISIGHIFVFFKKLLILLGSGVWFAITLIPFSIVYVATLSTYYIGRLIDEVYSCFAKTSMIVAEACSNFYIFVTDVPIESFIGLLVGLCLGYIFVQFYMTLFSYLHYIGISTITIIKNKVQYWINGTRQQLIVRTQELNVHTRTQHTRRFEMRSQRTVVSRRGTRPETASIPLNDDDERYCIICNENMKCILVLPCRHVCMCSECCSRLQYYNNICPVCRNEIEQTMKIFV